MSQANRIGSRFNFVDFYWGLKAKALQNLSPKKVFNITLERAHQNRSVNEPV